MKRRGFIDIQNNGWKSTDFSAPGLTVDILKTITRDLLARGTLAFCPTLVTAPPEVYRQNFAVVAAAMKDPEIGGHILGIHLEGPFISPKPGAVGAHPKERVLPPDPRMFDRFQEWAQGQIKILTVAPEQPGCAELIRHVSRQGVAVSLGHHLASDEEMEIAVKNGARLCTHVGNGIPNEIHRHNNPLWWQLACDEVSGLFITDGQHLPADLIKVALRAKTTKRFIVTSDASPLAGMPAGRYTIFSGLPVVIDENGRIYSEQSKSLAGSHSTIMECMNHLAGLKLLSEDELWQVGFVNPLRALGLTPGAVAKLRAPEIVFRKGRFALA
jgi:N-acetylglucosamine-6-phosphate deacetylase